VTLEPRHAVLRGGPLLIGHRGAAGLAPENTMPSFRLAVDRWAVDMIELDVRLSADGVCVVIHDATVDRTTDGTGTVAEKTVAELRALDAGYRFRDEAGEPAYRGRGAAIPSFDEVLESFPDTRFTVEIKVGTVQEALAAVIRKHDAAGRVIVAGMEKEDQARFRDYPGARSAATRDAIRFYIAHRLHLARAVPFGADVLQVPELHPWDGREDEGARRIVTPRFVADAARRGVPVHVWTVNDPGDMRRLLDWGVDGLITDRPDIGARVLADVAGRPLPPGLR
jgi:glycerophosphoryl diester phosphodiesterase